jgi:hypothetical protein
MMRKRSSLRKEKTALIKWLCEHLPGGPEMHLDRLPAIVASLESRNMSFLREFRRKVEAKK